MKDKLQVVFNEFMQKPIKDVSPLGKGNINYTYKVSCENGEEYLLQRLNCNALPNINACLLNIEAITNHIKSKGETSLTLIKTKSGELSYEDSEGFLWRLYPFFSGSRSVDETDDLALIEELSRGFGKFDDLLCDLDVKKVQISDDNFHNTRQKYELLMTAVSLDKKGRVIDCIDEIEWASELIKLCKAKTGEDIFNLSDELFSGNLPMQVVHNDTKLNNALLTKDNKVLCVVDLDTAMPGTILNDFGDGVRFACNTASEEEYDLSKVEFSISRFEAFTKGFFGGYKRKLTKEEVKFALLAPISIAFELGCRFFEDYINGDVFFRVVSSKVDFNLARAKVQFKLCESMISKFDDIKNILSKYLG